LLELNGENFSLVLPSLKKSQLDDTDYRFVIRQFFLKFNSASSFEIAAANSIMHDKESTFNSTLKKVEDLEKLLMLKDSSLKYMNKKLETCSLDFRNSVIRLNDKK